MATVNVIHGSILMLMRGGLLALIALAVPAQALELNDIGKGMLEPSATQTFGPATELDYSSDIQGLSGRAIADALSNEIGDRPALALRGVKEIELYRRISPSVVVVYTNDAHGSGSYLGNGTILTNWHLTGAARQVGVRLKPRSDGANISDKNVLVADVIRINKTKDLALLKLKADLSNLKLVPIELGDSSEIQIGADVHAIGHPFGQYWTYTRGIISQFRKDFEYGGFRASVIQTQTPINPGNSGGPLLGDSGKLLGVNSFGHREGDERLLNFAVAVTDVRDFLTTPDVLPGPAIPCEPKVLSQGRTKDDTGNLVQIDRYCKGTSNLQIYTPDNREKAIQARIDSNFDGKPDILVEDVNRDKKWDISFHDIDFDDTIDLVGRHPDGKLAASSFEKYDPAKKYAGR